MKLKQLEPVVETVGEYKFYITPFPALKAANMTGELASLMLPLFGALAPLIKDGDSEKKENSSKKENGLMDMDAGEAAAAIAASITIDGNKTEKLIQKFLLGGHITVELEDEDGDTEGYRLDEDLLNEIFCGEVWTAARLSLEVPQGESGHRPRYRNWHRRCRRPGRDCRRSSKDRRRKYGGD